MRWTQVDEIVKMFGEDIDRFVRKYPKGYSPEILQWINKVIRVIFIYSTQTNSITIWKSIKKKYDRQRKNN